MAARTPRAAQAAQFCILRVCCARGAPSSQARVLLECDRGELGQAHELTHVPPRRVDLDLPNVRVAPVLVVGQDGHLDEVCPQRRLRARIVRRRFARRQNGHPATWLVELFDVDLLQVVERRPSTDRYLRWRVALIEFEVRVNLDLVNAHLLVELDVDQVWLRAVRSAGRGGGE